MNEYVVTGLGFIICIIILFGPKYLAQRSYDKAKKRFTQTTK